MTRVDVAHLMPRAGHCGWCGQVATAKHEGTLCCDACARTDARGRIEAWLKAWNRRPA